MSLITFHNNKNLLFALIYWALEIITRVLMHYKWELFQIVENDSILIMNIFLLCLNV